MWRRDIVRSLVRVPRRGRSAGTSSYGCEPLERRLLLATINWTNKGTLINDTDGFNAAYGGSATAARNIVQRAIDDWARVLVDLNQSGGGNTFNVTFTALNLGGGNRGNTTGIVYDASNKPLGATITLDDDGGGAGWYFDPNVGTSIVPDDSEFLTFQSPFQGNGPVGGFDLYRTSAHELGHALGLATTSTRLTSIDVFIGDDPVDTAAAVLFTIDVDGGGADYTYTNANGFHLYEGPAVGGNPVHPNELMNDGRTAIQGRRQLISDTIVSLLRDVFDYTVTLPSFINTFYANLNTASNVVTINGDIDPSGDDADVIDLEVDGTAMSFEVNGTDEVIEGAQFTTINVNAGLENDDIDVDELLSGKTLTVNGGGGNDNISAAQELGDIDTDIDSNFTINGDAGTDTILFHDVNDAAGGDTYLLTSLSFTKNPLGTNRIISYSDAETLIINGAGVGSTYNINSLGSTASLTINAGAAADTITVGGTVGDIDNNVLGDVFVHGNGGTDNLIFNDAADNASVDDSYTLTSIGFDKSSTSSIFSFDTVENLTLTAGLADNTINVLSASGLAFGLQTLTVNGNDGNDTIEMGVGDLEVDFSLTAVTVNGDAGNDLLYLDDSDDADPAGDSYTLTSTTFDKSIASLNLFTYGTMEDLTLDCGTLDNTVNINSFSTSGAPDLDTLIVNGNGGNDTFHLGTGDLESNLAFTAVVVNGNNGVDSLVANDGGDGEGDDSYTLTTATIDKNTAGLTIPITYGTFEDVSITASTFNNIISVTSTLSSAIYTVAGNNGNDTFNIGSPGNNVGAVDGAITVTGGSGTDDLNYNDQANAAEVTYTVSANTVDRTGAAVATYGTMESLVVNGGSGSTHTINSTAANTPVTIFGNAGDDLFVVGSGDWDTNILSDLTLIGGADTDTLRINDTSDAVSDDYTITDLNSTKSSSDATISYSGLEAYVLDANDSANVITLTSSFNGDFTLNGNGGADTIDILGNFAGTFVTVDGGAALDSVKASSGDSAIQFNSSQDLAGLQIDAGGNVRLNSGGDKLLYTQTLGIEPTGRLNLSDNTMIVDYTGESPLPLIQAHLTSGYAGGAWDGDGINSSIAAATSNRDLGFAEATDLFSTFPANFAGQSIDNQAVLVRYTVSADANLDRRVDVHDLNLLANNWLQADRRWSQGDFTFDQLVNKTDLGEMAINWHQAVPQPAPALPAQPTIAARRAPTRTPVRTIALVENV